MPILRQAPRRIVNKHAEGYLSAIQSEGRLTNTRCGEKTQERASNWYEQEVTVDSLPRRHGQFELSSSLAVKVKWADVRHLALQGSR